MLIDEKFYFRYLTADIVKCAQEAGYKVLVLTVDSKILGFRYADARNKFQMPSRLQ